MPRYELPAPALIAGDGLKSRSDEPTHMIDALFETIFNRCLCEAARHSDPVPELARAREQALAAWNEAQDEADHIMAEIPRAVRRDPKIQQTSGYTAAYERSMRLLDPIIEIEGRLEETTATTPAGLLVQARLLEAALLPSGHGGDRLLACIIAGLESMTEAARDC